MRAAIMTLIVLLVLWGCGSEDLQNSDLANETGVTTVHDVHWMANRCITVASDAGVLSLSPQGYFLSEDAADAVALFFKPSGLGRYMLFDINEQWLQADVYPQPVGQAQLDERVIWAVHRFGDQQYQLQAQSNGQWLTVNGHQLQLTSQQADAAAFSFSASQGCAMFPEATTNSVGVPNRSQFEDGAVWGFADVHNHLFGSMSFAGNVMSGDVFHPLGISKALQDCRAEHGVNGWMDVTGFVTSGPGDEFQQLGKIPGYYLFGQPFHNTAGYPDFTYWPNAQTKTHAMGYYKWLERAYLGGLRLMVNLLVESPPLCQVARSLNRWYEPYDPLFLQDPNVVCTGEVTARAQLQATLALQDYIDAQEGGPGRGWFRVVTTPEQARAVIRDKKLAVIVGAELPDLFDCIDGVETGRAECTPDYIRQRLDEYDELGIRTIFPVHHYDNDFGGATVFNPIIEVAKVVQNGELFHYEPCEDSGYDPLLAVKLPAMYYNLFPQIVKQSPWFPFVPQADQYCNSQSITPLGELLVMELMQRGMLIETNHMSPKMKLAVLELAETHDYPLVDTHQRKAWDDEALQFESRYLSLGGVRSPMPNMSAGVEAYGPIRKTCNSNTSQDFAIQVTAVGDVRGQLDIDPGVVMSTDLHGMVSQSQPRFGERADCDQLQMLAVEYPFTSVDGSVQFDRQQTGNRVFDYNHDGLAHYGLLPDMIEDMRRQGLADHTLQQLFRGAESYLQTWEKARQRAASLR